MVNDHKLLIKCDWYDLVCDWLIDVSSCLVVVVVVVISLLAVVAVLALLLVFVVNTNDSMLTNPSLVSAEYW